VPGGVKAMAAEVSAWFAAEDFGEIDVSKLLDVVK
jgi:hypothetical protein